MDLQKGTMDNQNMKRDFVISSLMQSIQNGEYQRGEALTERALAEKLNVSRTPVREAFRCLEELGVLVSEPHKGVRISTYSEKKISNLYAVRELLEGLATREATENATPEGLEKLASILEEAREKIKVNDIEALACINQRFHSQIATMSGNDYLINSLRQVRENIGLLFSKSLHHEGRPERSIEEHIVIYKAMSLGYQTLAEDAARHHIKSVHDNIIMRLNNQILDK